MSTIANVYFCCAAKGRKPRPYRLVRSHRRTLSLEITKELELLVRAPFFTPLSVIDTFVASREAWIAAALERQKNRPQRPELPPEDLAVLKAKAKAVIPQKVAHYAKVMGMTPDHGPYPAAITITAARTRWGSCSANNRLSFSCRLMQYPDAAIDYVVVHELAHIYHKNHGPAFYRCIEQYLPDYKARRALLKEPPQESKPN